ncbi:MAG: outer membrane protein transport protein [Hydrogenophilales bacterium]|nr:outer membrane protein transport protein [Hydrogenophilales bacterium]
MKLSKLAVALMSVGFATGAYATNGMNMEGYGPIGAAMGGASMAYDNGNAAMMNNPATLGLAQDGNRLDLAIGFLGPDVKAVCASAPCTGASATSGGDAYLMPAGGWTRKAGALTYGVGMFAQGGMGAEYAGSTWIGMADGMAQRSELGVGRLIAPLSYNVNDKLSLGGSLDFVWANLDIKMAMPGNVLMGLVEPTSTMALPGVPTVGRIDFSDDNDYTGKAKGTGWAGKLGFVYKASPMVSIGGTFHSKTSLDDLETSSRGSTFMADLTGDGAYTAAIGEVMPGRLTVRDFEWPETFAFGVAIQATPQTMLAMDIKHIGWADVMEKFSMTFEPFGMPAGTKVDFALPQNWDDQTVVQVGVAHKVSDVLTLRAGASFASNPIPDQTVNYLFPAIVENHVSFGLGYVFNKDSELNFALTYAPETNQTSPGMPMLTPDVEHSHSQTNWQVMYTRRF